MKNISEKNQIEILEAAFESSYDGIHILDKNGRTIYINQACTRIEGISKQEAMEKTISQLVEEGVYSQSVTLIVLETKEPATIIQTAKNGNEILVTGTPIYKDREIDKIIVNSRDITELSALEKKLQLQEEELKKLRKEQIRDKTIHSKNAKMQKVMNLALTVARVDSTVLLTGESGVGKGVISQFIHKNSSRRDGPFIKIDCSTIPETLFESELFGYEKGAFTGAEKHGKVGLLELANGGTVFLDELGEMPLSMQTKFLSAIQDRKVNPVGGDKVRKLDVRILAATNADLKKMVEEKTFREDLYYRLNVIPIEIPPLRERREDIPPLIHYMTAELNAKYGWQKRITMDALSLMMEYSWPGNVRELENLIERLLVSVEAEVITAEDLPKTIRRQPVLFGDQGVKYSDYKNLLAEYDYELIRKAIEETGSIVSAAKALQVDVTTVRRKLKKYEKK